MYLIKICSYSMFQVELFSLLNMVLCARTVHVCEILYERIYGYLLLWGTADIAVTGSIHYSMQQSGSRQNGLLTSGHRLEALFCAYDATGFELQCTSGKHTLCTVPLYCNRTLLSYSRIPPSSVSPPSHLIFLFSRRNQC
jgi:hypothetical protein